MNLPVNKIEAYQNGLLKTFQRIFNQNLDHAPPTATIIKSPNRQEILFIQYPMQKKGKNFNSTESRTFKIDNNDLKQVDKNGKERDLPYPSTVVAEQIGKGASQQWQKPAHKHRLLLEFSQRTPVYIYFKDKDSCMQIHSFLIAKSKPFHKQLFKESFRRIYKQKIMGKFLSSLMEVKKSNNLAGMQKKKAILIQKIKIQLSSSNLIRSFVMEWHKRALMTAHHKNTSISSISIQFQSLTASRKHEELKDEDENENENGELKIWIGNTTSNKVIKFGKKEEKKQSAVVFIIDQLMELNENDKIGEWCPMQFQVEMRNGENDVECWKSDRFYLMDLVKSVNERGKVKSMNMFNKQKLMTLSFKIKSLKSTLFDENSTAPPHHTPLHYPILRQIIPISIFNTYVTALDSSKINHQYLQASIQFIREHSVENVSYTEFRKLYDLLCIDALIQKFYTNYPFNQYVNVQCKGTFIYQYLVRKATKFSFYDAEKFVWKEQATNMRRFLSVLKSFDEIPRINFTEPFFTLCKQCLNLCTHQSLIKYKQQLFERSIIGRESMAFFLVLALLKISSSLLLYQPHKSMLSNNSLLFHYFLKKHENKIYSKFLKIQLNIEALFGIYSVGLFSELVNYGVFAMVIGWLAKERKQQMSNPDVNNNRNKHFLSLISAFISIVKLVDNECQAGYISGRHYPECIKYYCSYVLDSKVLQFSQLFKQYYQLCEGALSDPQYMVLQINLQKYYRENNQMNGSISVAEMNLGDILEQLYSEFMCYKHKNEADIRKMYINIDHIQISSNVALSNSLIISIYQHSAKIYSHQLFIHNPQGHKYQNLKHPIELKLVKLDEITLVFTIKGSVSYYCEVDPKSIPSNYYIQCTQELFSSNGLEIYAGNYIMMQVYVKDSCEVSYIENTVPSQYINSLLLKNRLQQMSQQYKQDIIFSNHYFKSFRFPENNTNLLYSKLGWYGCHYLIPKDRILEIYKISTAPNNDIEIKQLSGKQEQRIFQILFYTRCIYGRGIVPTINYSNANSKMSLLINSVYGGISVRNSKKLRHEVCELAYNSCSNLGSYLYENFGMEGIINGKVSFVEFWDWANSELPLIRFLGFKTLQFYVLEQITIKMNLTSSPVKSCRIILSNHPLSSTSPHKFISNFEQLRQYEQPEYEQMLLSVVNQIQEFVFTYCDEKLTIDQFLWSMKMNILKYYSDLPTDSSKNRKVQKKTKGKTLFGSIKIKDEKIPNFQIYKLYQLILQTSYEVQFEFSVRTIAIQQYPQFRFRNRIFDSFGLIQNTWKNVAVLAQLQSTNHQAFYVQEEYNRRKLLLKGEDVIIGSGSGSQWKQAVLEYTDQELIMVKECVKKDLAIL